MGSGREAVNKLSKFVNYKMCWKCYGRKSKTEGIRIGSAEMVCDFNTVVKESLMEQVTFGEKTSQVGI
jgi:hypothetical protein